MTIYDVVVGEATNSAGPGWGQVGFGWVLEGGNLPQGMGVLRMGFISGRGIQFWVWAEGQHLRVRDECLSLMYLSTCI